MSTTISELANETLSEIFQHLYHSLTVDEWYKQMLPSLRLVSGHWNEIIETFPMLWTSILITEKSAFQAGQPLFFQSTRLRIFRSLQLPLNIYINLHNPSRQQSFMTSDVIRLDEIIEAVAPRIASIKLHTNSHSCMIQTIVLNFLNGPRMPLLRSFSYTISLPKSILIARPSDDRYFQIPPSILQYQGRPETRRIITEWGKDIYPSLTSIKLVGALYDLEHLPIIHGIRLLHIGPQPLARRPSLNQLLEILSPAKDTLESLKLEDMVDLTSTDTQLATPIVFEKLRVLSFGYPNAHIAHMFLESVRLPALVDLTLTFTLASQNPENHHIWIAFNLIRHFPLKQIKSLTLTNVLFPPDGRYDIEIPPLGEEASEAQRASFLEVLRFHGFAQTSAGCWRMPLFMYFIFNLRTLKHFCLYDTTGLKKMMSAYWRKGTLSSLETLDLDGCPEGLFELTGAVEGFRKSGDRPLPLHMRIGENLQRVMSTEEKAKLYCRFRALAEL